MFKKDNQWGPLRWFTLVLMISLILSTIPIILQFEEITPEEILSWYIISLSVFFTGTQFVKRRYDL